MIWSKLGEAAVARFVWKGKWWWAASAAESGKGENGSEKKELSNTKRSEDIGGVKKMKKTTRM